MILGERSPGTPDLTVSPAKRDIFPDLRRSLGVQGMG